MGKGLIKIAYQKLIDSNSNNIWDKCVFEDTYKEYYMQAQQFDQGKQYPNFKDLLANNPKADQMHYLVSTAAIAYIRQLNDYIPELLNEWKKSCIPFKNFRFEIIESHIEDKNQHKVVIYFYSEILTWIDTIDNKLLLSQGNQSENLKQGIAIETEMLSLPPQASIVSFQAIN